MGERVLFSIKLRSVQRYVAVILAMSGTDSAFCRAWSDKGWRCARHHFSKSDLDRPFGAKRRRCAIRSTPALRFFAISERHGAGSPWSASFRGQCATLSTASSRDVATLVWGRGAELRVVPPSESHRFIGVRDRVRRRPDRFAARSVAIGMRRLEGDDAATVRHRTR